MTVFYYSPSNLFNSNKQIKIGVRNSCYTMSCVFIPDIDWGSESCAGICRALLY